MRLLTAARMEARLRLARDEARTLRLRLGVVEREYAHLANGGYRVRVGWLMRVLRRLGDRVT